MRRSFLLAMLVAVLGSTGPAEADNEFWVDFGDGTYLVGQFESDLEGNVWVASAYFYDDPDLIRVPDCLRRHPFPDPEETTNLPPGSSRLPDWGCTSFYVYPLSEEAIVMVVDAPDAAMGSVAGGGNDPDGNGTAGGTGSPDGSNTTGGQPFESFFTLLIPDGFGDWGAFLTLGETELEESLLYGNPEQLGSDPGQDGTSCGGPTPGMGGWFFIPLGPNEVLIVVLHADGSVEMYVYAKSVDGCWFAATQPDGYEPPGLDQLIMIDLPGGDGEVYVPTGD